MASSIEDIPAPQGYLVLDSPNREENGSSSCPHDGCDGFTFDSRVECIIHEAEWHKPPYQCAECREKFAAHPALDRHAIASGHRQEWVCREPRCPENEVRFGTHLQLICHTIGSLAHQRVRDARYYTRGGTAKSYKEAAWEEGSIEELTSEATAEEEEYKCDEPCCYKYQHGFSSNAELIRHLGSEGHVSAAAMDVTLRGMDITDEERETKRQAARRWECDGQNCPRRGNQFSTTKSFFKHITTKAHLDGKKPKPEKIAFGGRCTTQACAKYQHKFKSEMHYSMHMKSPAHVRAAESEARFATPGPAPLTIEATTPLRSATTTFFGGLVSPVTPTGWFASPTTGESRRRPLVFYDSDEDEDEDDLKQKNEALETENAQLRERVLRLEAELTGPLNIGFGQGREGETIEEKALARDESRK